MPRVVPEDSLSLRFSNVRGLSLHLRSSDLIRGHLDVPLTAGRKTDKCKKQEPSVKYLLMQKQLYMWRAFLSLHGPCSQQTAQKPQTRLTSSASRLFFFFFLFFLNQFTACGGILNYVHTHTKKNTFKTQEAVQFDFAIKLTTEILSNK